MVKAVTTSKYIYALKIMVNFEILQIPNLYLVNANEKEIFVAIHTDQESLKESKIPMSTIFYNKMQR